MKFQSMHLRVIHTFFSLFIASAIFSQTIKLTGKVTNEKNEPVVGVSINVTGGGGTTSNIDGLFSLSLIPETKYEISFSAVGYTPKAVTDVEVTTAANTEFNVVLQTAPKDLANIVVSATRSTARRESVNSIITFQKNTHS